MIKTLHIGREMTEVYRHIQSPARLQKKLLDNSSSPRAIDI